jgi:hypothetical protein
VIYKYNHKEFIDIFKEKYKSSYNNYSHMNNEIVIETTGRTRCKTSCFLLGLFILAILSNKMPEQKK